MIDLEKEEFLKRLDIRIAAISSILAYHEKYLLRDLSHKEYKDASKLVDRMNSTFNNFIVENDEKLKRFFEETQAKMEREVK